MPAVSWPLGATSHCQPWTFTGGSTNERKKTPELPVGELFEFERQVEVVVIFARGEIAVLLVGTALADEVALLVHVPLLRAVGFPAREVFSVEKLDFTARLARQLLDLQVAERGRIAVVLQADDAPAGPVRIREQSPTCRCSCGRTSRRCRHRIRGSCVR